ncbi:MAG: M18 family aminopeptidase, partial [Proteocatella sp.]
MGYQVEALFDFLDNAKSIYHVVDFAKKYLLKNDFIELDLSQKFDLIEGGKYFVIQKGAIFAFRIDSLDDGCYIIGSHTDSPSIAIKSNPVIHENDYIKLNTEIYGGPILSTWFDRPLSIAGCVHIEGEDPLNPIEKLIDFEEEVCIIPNLAIHMNREVNNGFAINKQNHMLPIISLEGDKVE